MTKPIQPNPPAPNSLAFSRRQVVQMMLGGAAIATVGPFVYRLAVRERSTVAPSPLAPNLRATLVAVFERLLPHESQAPGASDIHAIAYLEGALADPRIDPDDVLTLFRGLDALETLVEREAGSFATLPAEKQDQLLHAMQADDRHAEWLAVMIVFALEALLADPVYGGNFQEQGWQWLGLDAAPPRPQRRWNEVLG